MFNGTLTPSNEKHYYLICVEVASLFKCSHVSLQHAFSLSVELNLLQLIVLSMSVFVYPRKNPAQVEHDRHQAFMSVILNTVPPKKVRTVHMSHDAFILKKTDFCSWIEFGHPSKKVWHQKSKSSPQKATTTLPFSTKTDLHFCETGLDI